MIYIKNSGPHYVKYIDTNKHTVVRKSQLMDTAYWNYLIQCINIINL